MDCLTIIAGILGLVQRIRERNVALVRCDQPLKEGPAFKLIGSGDPVANCLKPAQYLAAGIGLPKMGNTHSR